jgi:leucyl/phenylalanyl-tRNA--protein transferase
MTSEAEAHSPAPELPWIVEGQPLPPVSEAWDASSPAPGLLAASSDLSAQRLMDAYAEGVFPWFNVGQPVLWWSPDPRMVLQTRDFRFHRSLQQSLKRLSTNPDFELCFDRDFAQVIRRCATSPRAGQKGTWIVPQMVAAYEDLHRTGLAHSCELRIRGELVAGLYFVALGHAVFGESMFTTVTDGSKMALACLVSVCLQHGVCAIDCQQNTRHLALMGARELPRSDFLRGVHAGLEQAPIDWARQSFNWTALASSVPPQ